MPLLERGLEQSDFIRQRVMFRFDSQLTLKARFAGPSMTGRRFASRLQALLQHFRVSDLVRQ